MNCPSCGKKMEEVSKWQMAPYGGWVCPGCGLKIGKKTSSRMFRFWSFWF